MTANVTRVPSLHDISYAYPSSPAAARVGKGKVGCYTLTIDGKETPHATLDAALAEAQAMGTSPGRWSIDHPLNAWCL